MLTAIVLAAGLSRRMGQNKLLFDLGGKTVIESILCTINTVEAPAGLTEKLIVTKNDDITAIGKKHGFGVVRNEHPELGQGHSVRVGVLAADKSADYVFFVADQPFVTTSIINTLIAARVNLPDKIIVPVNNGKKGNPVIFPNSCRSGLIELSADEGGRGLLKKYADIVSYIEIDDERAFYDIDTPNDYERIRKLFADICG